MPGTVSVLDHPEQAERIRRAGRARTLRDHTWASVWRDILGDDRLQTV